MKKLLLVMLSVLLLASCGSGSVATVGNTKIAQSEFEFYLESIKNQMSDTELQTDEDWESKEIEGKKAIDVAKQQAMDNAVRNALYIEAAEAAGISLTEEDKKTIEATKEQLVSGYGSEKAYKEFLKNNNITDEFIEMMCKSSVYYNKIGQIVTEEKTVEDAELEAYYEQNKAEFEREIRKAKHILIATMDPATNLPKSQEEQDKASILAKEILGRVQNGEDFDALMNQYSEDPGLSSNPDGYVFGTGEMVSEFEEATDSVGFGGIAFCKSDFGFHIIKRLPISYNEAKDMVRSEFFGKLIDEKVEEWKKEYSIEIKQNEKLLAEIK